MPISLPKISSDKKVVVIFCHRVVIDYFDGYKTGSFRDLMWYGTDTDIYEFLIALIILPVVLILLVSWLKCFIFKFIYFIKIN